MTTRAAFTFLRTLLVAFLLAALYCGSFAAAQSTDDLPWSDDSRPVDVARPATQGEASPAPAAAPAATADTPFMPLDMLVGRWSAGEGENAFSFVILARGGQSGGKASLEAHTDRRVWKGHYNDNPDGVLVAEFFYRPRADEMDAAIPEWARSKLDGDVEWQIKLFARGPDHHPHLDMEWHRQQIRWDDAKKTAELVEDEGEPLTFTLSYAPLLQMTQPAPVSIGVFPVRPPEDAYKTAGALSSVLQQQHFVVELSAPFQALEKLGRTISVDFKGETSGKTTSVTLEARVPPGEVGTRVVYVTDKPVNLGDCTGESRYEPATMSLEWFYSLKAEGPCLPFNGTDGEVVRLSVGKSAEYRFQWWKNWMSASLAAQRDEIERRRIAYNAVLSAAGADAATKNAARDKITMIRNYDALMRSDRLLPQHKVAIGDIYLGGDRGLGSYATYSGQTYGYSIPSKGLLSYSKDDFQAVVDHTRDVRWPAFEPGPYVAALTVYSNYVSWLFGYNTDGALLGSQAVAILPPDRKDFAGNDIAPVPDDKVDAALKRDIVWAHPVERLGVSMAIGAISSGRINEISESFFKQGAMLMYDGMADESGAGFVYIFANWLVENAPAIMNGLEEGKWPALDGPRDYRGEPIDGWGIAQSASSFVLNFAAEIGQVTRYFTPKHFWVPDELKSGTTDVFSWRSKIGTPEKAEQLYTVSKRPGAGQSLISKGDALADELPRSIPPELRKDLAVPYTPAALEPERLVSAPPVSASAAKADGPIGAGNAADIPSRNDIVTAPDKVEVAIPLAAAGDARLVYKPVLPGAEKLAADYGAGAKLAGEVGSILPVQQAKYSDGLIAANYVIGRQTGLARNEATGAMLIQDVLQHAAANGKISPEYIFYFGHADPYPDAILNHYLAGHGVQVVDHPGGNRAARLIDAHVATEGGWMVSARLGGGGKPSKTVVIDRIVLDAQGAPETVRVFDPTFGTMVEIDAATFNARLDRGGDNSVFRAMRVKEPDTRPAARAPANGAANDNAPRPDVAPAPAPVPAVTPGLPSAAEFAAAPQAGKVFRYQDASNPSNTLVVPLGEKLGQGSFSQVYRHGDDPNLVVRINNPYGTRVGTQSVTVFDIETAQKMDDLGREGLEAAWGESQNFDMLPVYSVTKMPDGRRVEIVALARGEPAHQVLKRRARAALTADEAATMDNYDSIVAAGRKPDAALTEARKPVLKKLALAEKYTSEEARAIALTLRDLNNKGYVALDMHNHNFNILEVDGRIKIEVLDPGGIVPVKGRDPAAAKRAQGAIVLRSDADIAFYRKHSDLFSWYDERQDIIQKIGDDLDFDAIDIDPDLLPFKPAMGLMNPEIGEIYKTL